jgi:acyl-CoA synthetase (AMP-forming)/AMP-acid ligase II
VTGPHIATLLEAISDRMPERLALGHGPVSRTWADLDDRAARLAAVLTAAGISPGATVAIDMYNCPEYLETFYAALKIRAVPANVNYRYVSHELGQLLDNADAEALVVHASLAPEVLAVRRLLPRLRIVLQVDDVGGSSCPEGVTDYESAILAAEPAPRIERSPDDHYLSFTGGTTGLPKGVMYHLGRSTLGALGLRDQFLGRVPGPDDDPVEVAVGLAESGRAPVGVPASPLMHSAGLIYASIPTLLAGGTVVTLTSRSFDPIELLDTISRRRVSLLAIVGDAFARPLLRALEEAAASGRLDAASLRVICSAGVAWSAPVKERLLELLPGVILYDSCGSTEGVTYGRRRVSDPSAAATANFDAAPGLVVLGPDRQPVPAGEPGLLAGPTDCDGYYKDPERSARTFFERDGRTYAVPGDFGRIEPDGSVTLIGRGTSTINTGGEKVHPEEVEAVLLSVPGVEGAIVVGVPDERFGQVVAAVVERRPGASVGDATLQAEARRILAGYKIPRRIVFVDRLPRLPNGKADFPAARALLGAGG